MTDSVNTAALRAPLPDNARMDAYYYGFDRTGIGAIDAILSAVAVAGKGAHHTDSWGHDDFDTAYYYGSRASEGLVDGAATAVELIQFVANRSAEQVRAAADEIDALRARAERAEAFIAEMRAWRSTWKEWMTTSRASQPAVIERQVQYDDGGWSPTVEVYPASEVEQ